MTAGTITQEELDANYGQAQSEDGEGAPICEWYLYQAEWGYYLKTALGLIITAVNTVIRMIVISLITWINYKTET
jgi:hypothetical protein